MRKIKGNKVGLNLIIRHSFITFISINWNWNFLKGINTVSVLVCFFVYMNKNKMQKLSGYIKIRIYKSEFKLIKKISETW